MYYGPEEARARADVLPFGNLQDNSVGEMESSIAS